MRTLRLILIALAVGVTGNAQAAYDFALDSFELTNNGVTLINEYNGVDPDPIMFFPLAGTTTVGGGFLNFTDTDGAAAYNIGGVDLEGDVVGAFLNAVSAVDPNPVVVTGSFRDNLGAIAGMGFGSGHGITLGTTGDPRSLGVLADGLGNVFVTYQNLASNTVYASDLIAAASGNVVLELELDRGTGLLAARYSADGGTVFKDMDDWAFPNVAPGVLEFTGPDDLLALPGAFGQSAVVVPLPAPLLLMLSALGGLGLVRRSGTGG